MDNHVRQFSSNRQGWRFVRPANWLNLGFANLPLEQDAGPDPHGATQPHDRVEGGREVSVFDAVDGLAVDPGNFGELGLAEIVLQAKFVQRLGQLGAGAGNLAPHLGFGGDGLHASNLYQNWELRGHLSEICRIRLSLG